MSTTVLVNGAAGYIGSVLCGYLLRAGHRVIAVDSFMYNNAKSLLHLLGDNNFSLVQADVRNLEDCSYGLSMADVVIPLAALVGAPACDKNPNYARQVNADAVCNLVKKLSSHQRLVYPNTNSGYGQTDGVSFACETDPLVPISLYARTKTEAEKAVLDHPFGTSLRLATAFGPSPRMRFDLMVHDFVCHLVQDRTLDIFEGHFFRNFVHVRDIARTFVRMVADHNLVGVYNVADPNANMTKVQLARTIARLLCINPDEAIRNCRGQDGDARNCKVSTTKLLRTGFRFKHALGEGVLDVALLQSYLTPADIAIMRNTTKS